MFAFAGASTFPSIQADMKDKTKFPKAVVVAMVILASIYLTMSATSWGLLGDRYPAISSLIGCYDDQLQGWGQCHRLTL